MKKMIVIGSLLLFPATAGAQSIGCFEEWRSGANGNCSLNKVVCDLKDREANYRLLGLTVGSLCEEQIAMRKRVRRDARLIRALRRQVKGGAK